MRATLKKITPETDSQFNTTELTKTPLKTVSKPSHHHRQN